MYFPMAEKQFEMWISIRFRECYLFIYLFIWKTLPNNLKKNNLKYTYKYNINL